MEHKEVNLPATTLRQFTSDLSQGCLIPKPVYRKLFFFFSSSSYYHKLFK
jgi:hypothetical protein